MPKPSPHELQGFLLGTLVPAEAERVNAWMEASPEAAKELTNLPAHDALTNDLAATTQVQAAPVPQAVMERIVKAVTQTLARQEPSAPSTTPLTQLGKFRIVRELGAGGMGVVYEAVDERLSRRVALKVVRPKWAEDAVIRQRFLREGRAAAALTSDHLVTVHEADEVEGTPYLAMEYLEGATLEDWLKARTHPVTEADLLWVARQVLAGLADIQRRGLVHRDIKPHNLWVDERTGRIKLLDFGLARNLEHGDSITQRGGLLGTPAYMSPEQADGAFDVRSDLFSLGAVLHRMVTGRSPFQRQTLPATLAAVAADKAPPLTGISPEMNRFVARLLAKDPEERPKDAAAALAELQALEAPQSATPPVEPALPPRVPRRRLLIASGLAAVLTLLMAGVIIIIWNKDGKQVARIELDDRVAPGGKVEMIDPSTGKSTSLMLPPSKPITSATSTKPIINGKDWIGRRVTVIVQTNGFVNRAGTVQRRGNVITEGTKGKVMDYNDDRDLCCVLLDGPTEEQVWLRYDVLLRLPE